MKDFDSESNIDTSRDAEFAQKLWEQLNAQPDTSGDADFAKWLSENKRREYNSSDSVLASHETDQWTQIDTCGEVDVTYRHSEDDQDGNNYFYDPIDMPFEDKHNQMVTEDDWKIPTISNSISFHSQSTKNEYRVGKSKQVLSIGESLPVFTGDNKVGNSYHAMKHREVFRKASFYGDLRPDLTLPEFAKITHNTVVGGGAELPKPSCETTNVGGTRVFSDEQIMNRDILTKGIRNSSVGMIGDILYDAAKCTDNVEQEIVQNNHTYANDVSNDRMINDRSKIVIHSNNRGNRESQRKNLNEWVVSSNNAKEAKMIAVFTELNQKQTARNKSLVPDFWGINCFKANYLNENPACGNNVKGLSKGSVSQGIRDSPRSIPTKDVEVILTSSNSNIITLPVAVNKILKRTEQKESTSPDIVDKINFAAASSVTKIQKQKCAITMDGFLSKKVGEVAEEPCAGGVFDTVCTHEETRIPNTGPINDAYYARRLTENVETGTFNDLTKAKELEKYLNQCQDTSGDAALARSMDISWDAEIAISLSKYGDTNYISTHVNLPGTSHDAAFARAIAENFEESKTTVGNTRSAINSFFLEEKGDFPGGFCSVCHTPQTLNLKMRLVWMKGQVDLNFNLWIVEHDIDSTEMQLEVGGNDITLGYGASWLTVPSSKLEVIGSPCSCCGSLIGSNEISIAICSVIRRAKVPGRKAVNFDLAKQFIDVVTWLAPSLTSRILPIKILYHWTNRHNFESILDKNLIVPGNCGVRVVNGSALGVGIYASDDFRYGRSYGEGAQEAVMLLGLLVPNNKPLGQDRIMERYSNYRVSGSRHVFYKSEMVFPLFLTSARTRYEQEEIANFIIVLLNKLRPIAYE